MSNNGSPQVTDIAIRSSLSIIGQRDCPQSDNLVHWITSYSPWIVNHPNGGKIDHAESQHFWGNGWQPKAIAIKIV